MDTISVSSADAIKLTARQIAPTFAAEVRDMPIHGDVSPELVSQFVALLHRYRVLIVPGANVGLADLVAFSRRFGPLEIHSNYANTLPAHREVFCVGNVERDGAQASFSRGVEQWHADSSFREIPSDASLFYGEIVPDEGGETLFADVTAAWRSLDPALRQRIDGLRAVHSLDTLRQWNQQQNPDRAPDAAAQIATFPPVAQPLVRTHPATGARSLYVCPAVISHVEGMPPAESAALIESLIRHASQQHFVYSHRWHRGDLVMWDNRAVLHTASLFDHTKYQRLMYRTTVAGNAPGLAACAEFRARSTPTATARGRVRPCSGANVFAKATTTSTRGRTMPSQAIHVSRPARAVHPTMTCGTASGRSRGQTARAGHDTDDFGRCGLPLRSRK